MIGDAVAATLAAVVRELAPWSPRWCVIGSAAVGLHGTDPGPIGDIDVLVPAEAADAVAARFGLSSATPAPGERFRSSRLVRPRLGSVPVELMSDLEVRSAVTDAAWWPVHPCTRCWVPIDGVDVPIPERDELVAMLMHFDRPKDRRRRALLIANQPADG